jgi:hypothetical protein
MSGRLNRFQRAMLDWNDLHPYNAVHVIRVPAFLDPLRLRQAIQVTLEQPGLTNLSVDRGRGQYRFAGGPVVPDLKVIESGSLTGPSVAAEIERQLNTPFPLSDRFDPFRFFAAPEAAAFALGLAYFHPVADAEAVVWLLKKTVEAYFAKAAGRPAAAADRPTSPPGAPGLHRRGAVFRQLAALPEFVRVLRTSIRPRYRDADDFRNGFISFVLGEAELGALRAAGNAWGVTLNDLFLALLLHSLAPLAAQRRHAHRQRMAAGCIVNIRKDRGVSPGTFGLFLGSFMVAHEVPEGVGLREISAAVARQTARIKARQLYLATPAQLAFASFVLRFFSTRRKRSFYQKHCPLWGGITNMNLNTLWEEPAQGGPPDYLRGVSTGPVAPLVLSVTTTGDRVNIGLSYRTTVFSASDIGQVQRRLLEGVATLAPRP